jgi:hypothetical protein
MRGGGEMVDFLYTPKPASPVRFLGKTRSMGVPPKVTQKFIESVGFKAKNDRPIISNLKGLGFLDSSGVPTDRWRDYRDKSRARAVLADGIRDAYSGPFSLYPDAHRKDHEALTDFSKSQTDVAETTISLMVRTFKSLCELADFESATGPALLAKKAELEAPFVMPTTVAQREVAVTVNIQLVLPATKDGSIYDAVFESLRKHILSREE